MSKVKDLVKMKKGAFVKEHKELVKTLKSGSKSEQKKEANEQGAELKKVTGSFFDRIKKKK
jgi:hypothetical protein